MSYISKFRTPPTPEIYQLWYRYAEGSNVKLCSELSDIVDAESVPLSRLLEICQRYFPAVDDADMPQRAAQALVKEIEKLQLVLQDQGDAGRDFGENVNATQVELKRVPVDSRILQHSIERVLASNAQMQARLAETDARLTNSQQQIQSLQRDLHEAQKAMFVDTLTGLGNRRLFDVTIEQAIEGARQTAQDEEPQLCVLSLLDIDGFKQVNDTFGHAAADRVLRFVAENMQRLGLEASIARLGGDEFAMLHRVESFEQADKLAQELCDFLDSTELVLQPQKIAIGHLTVSLGVAVLRKEDDRQSWFDRADKLLYGAKRGGRNQVLCEPALGR
ncbi:MAG: GGDEF domain-containing protein [Aureliella sp.]